MPDTAVRSTGATDLLEVFAAAAQDVSEGGPIAPLSADTVLADLGFDSVQLLELVCCLEERLDVRLPPTALTGVATVDDLLGVLSATRRAGRAA
jgi:acyl carrier protein